MIITTGRTNASDACFTFQVFGLPGDPTPPTVYRNVRVYYDTRGGTPSQGETDGRVQVRGFFTQPEDNNNTDVSILIQNVGFQFHFDGTYRATVDVGSGVAPMSISMASVSHTLNRVDTALIANKPAAPPLLKVILQNCQYSPTSNWSCMDVNAGKLWLTPDAQNGSTGRKFVSGHEAGHWLDYHWGTTGTFASTGGGTSNYQFSAGSQQALAQTCRFTWSGNGGQGIYAHAMRSQEYQHAAVREAFAHFMALFSFNVASSSSTSNPQFLYYKTQSPGLVDGDYPANDIYYGTSSLTSSGIATPHSFLDSLQGCNCTVLGNCDGTSTQMQWMRAYWWYLFRDEPGGPKPSLTEFFGQIQASSKTNSGVSCHTSVDRCYGAVVGAIPPAYSARWQNVGTIMGLASDEP
ncbi:MAG: hypothetical protein IPK80_03745 [Nannocystis sp.]|nr:hypothetical protein [Nannocystis sp.]